MFSRTDHDVPEDFDFPTTLDELGLKRDLRGRYVLIADEDKFYNYRRYDTKSTNDKYSEAVHKAIRNDVYAWLDTMGIKLIYTHDKDLSTTSKIPGEKPKIKMLCGGFDADLKDVYVFIGDSRRELGIVSRVATDSEGGPREGTVLGVAKALQSRGSWSGLPAMLVLNPGELLYSYATKSCMTQDIWNTRKRPHAFAEQYAVTDKNKVPGHATPQEHVNTVLDHILPQLVEEQHERLHIIAVGDGGENVLKYLNEKFTDDPNAKIAGLTLVSVALVNSSHDTDTLNSTHLKIFMAKHGRAWDSSAEPKNTVLGKVAPEFAHYTQNNDNDNPSSDNEASGMSMVFPKRHVPHVGRKRAVSALSEGLKEQRRTGGPHNDITHIEADVFNDVFYSDSVGSPGSTTSSEAGIALPPLISDKYPSMSVPGLTMKQYRKECDSGPEGRRRSSASIEDTTLANPDQYRISGPSKPIPIPGREEAFKKFHTEEKRKKQEAKKEAKEKAAFEELKALGHKVDADMEKKKAEQAKKAAEAKKIIEEEIAAAERAMNEMAEQQQQPTFAPSPGHDIIAQYVTVPTRAEEAATITENENEAHDYYAKPFICTTVSAGLEDVTEQIFPAVREDVLKFVFEQEDMKETKRRVKEMLVRDLRRSVSSLGL